MNHLRLWSVGFNFLFIDSENYVGEPVISLLIVDKHNLKYLNAKVQICNRRQNN